MKDALAGHRWLSRSALVGAALMVTLLGVVSLGGCAVETTRGRSPLITERLRSELVRNKSTKVDVLKVLGEPDGTGSFGGWRGLRGPRNSKLGPLEVWYYADTKTSIGFSLRHNVRVMLIFFKDEVFHGYIWFANTSTGEFG